MSDSYISRLESLLTMLNSIIQTVPEAKKLLESVGVNTKDLEPTVKDSKTGEVIGQKTERQAQLRVEDAEEAIASNERLNQIIKERIALMQQEANAAKQVNAVTTAAKPSGTTPRGSSSSTPKERDLPGDYGVVAPVTPRVPGTGPSPKRTSVLREESDVNALSKPEISQLRTTVRAIAQKLTAAGSDRGAGLLQSIKPGSPVTSVVNAFEEAMTSVVADLGQGFLPAGEQVTNRMGNIQSFRQVLGVARQIVKKATARPIVSKNDLADPGSSGLGTSLSYITKAGSGSDEEGSGEYLRAGAEGRASGRSRRRSLHNTFGKFKDAVKHKLGIPVGKGTGEDLRVERDVSRGYMESASSGQLFQEGVDYDITRSMDTIVQNAIQDLRSGRVASPTTNPAAVGTNLASTIPKSLIATLSKFGPLVQGASRETTARGAIGRESKSLGVFGGPTAQNAFSGIFATFLAERLQENSGKSANEQINMLRGLNVNEIFKNLFAPDETNKQESKTTLAGILHQRVKDDLETKVKKAEEVFAAAATPEARKAASRDLTNARAEQRTYATLDEQPIVVPVGPSTTRGLVSVSTGGSYPRRTERNAAAAPVTLSYAADHATPGERKTASAVKAAGGVLVSDEGQSNEQVAARLVESLKATSATSLNVSGNAMPAWKKAGISQDTVNQNVYDILKIVKTQYPQLSTIVSGGQTGTDIAGSVAAAALGLNADVHMPDGYRQRDENDKDVRNTPQDIENYIQKQALALNPNLGRSRPTDATMPMKYSMAQSQLREDLKAKYLTGTTTSQLVEQGVRTATTRAGGGYKPGQVIEIPELPGKRYQVTSVEKPDFSTPEGIAAWEAKEGWSFKDLPDKLRRQVTNPKANQISFKPYEEKEDTPAGPSSVVIQPTRPVPADMISNPQARITGIENDPEEMIQRVAGGRFDKHESFRDMVTNIRPVASRALGYLKRLGRANLPVPFDSPTPLQVLAQNSREGLPLNDGLESQLKVDEEARANKNKFADSVLAGFGLISSNSKYQNFSQGLQVASHITDEAGSVDAKKARNLRNPLSQLKNFFSSMQLLEQAEYSSFPILDYASANDPKNPNEALAREMEAASPMLSKVSKRMLTRVRALSKSKEFKKTDSFGQFSMLSQLLRPILGPALAEGGEETPTVDTLVNAPSVLRKNLPILHTSGEMSDRIAQVMGNTADLVKAREEPLTVRPESMAKTLRFRISSLARAVLGRMPSPAYNDSVVQRHKREGIVDAGIREDLTVSDKLAEEQLIKKDYTEEERPGEFTFRSGAFSAGESVNLEEQRQEIDRILRAPEKSLTEAERIRKRGYRAEIEAGLDPLRHLQSADRQDNAENYDPAAAMVSTSVRRREQTNRSPLDNLIAKFQKYQGDNKGLKQLLATAIGDPKSREKALKLLGGVTPGMSNMLRYTDFGDSDSVKSYLAASAKDPKNTAMAQQISTFMSETKGHKYLENPAIADMFNVAAKDRPNEAVVEARHQLKAEVDTPMARRLGPVIGKLRILQKLKDFGRESKRDPSLKDTKFLSDMQTIFSVLAPEETEQFRKMDTKNPAHVQSLTETNAGKSLISKMRVVAQRLYVKHMRHPTPASVEPREVISNLTAKTPFKNVEFFVGGAAENAQILKRDTAVAEAKEKTEESPKELFLARLEENDRKETIAARDKENADRVSEVSEALDKKEFKEATEGKRRRYFGSNNEENQKRRENLFRRLTRKVRPLAWWEVKPVKRTKKKINEMYRNSPEYQEAKQREKNAKQEAKEAENVSVPEVNYGINPTVARGIPDFIKEFQEFDEPKENLEVKNLEIMRERERERQLPEVDRKREADRLADQESGQKALDKSRRQRRKEINAALDSKPKKRSKRERKKILDRLTRNTKTYEQEDFGKDEKGNPLFFTKREKDAYAPIPGDEANNQKIMNELREYYAGANVDKKYPIPKELNTAWFQRENPPRGIDTAIRAQYGDPTRAEYVNKYGSLFGGAGIDPEVASIPPSNPKAERGTSERSETAKRLFQARQQRRYATAKQLAVWNAEREGITDPAEKLAFAEKDVKRSEFATLAQIIVRGRQRIAEARENEADAAILPIVEKVQNRLNMEASGRFLLPAPDPSKPEEEYTKTAEQLAAEEPARKAAETARKRSEAARKGVKTRRRNAIRKRYEDVHNEYNNPVDEIWPWTWSGFQLEDKKQKKIDEDRINRRKARSIESKRREPETNAKVAAREAEPIAERTKRLEDERLANEAERQKKIDEDRINRRKARSIEGKRRQVEREEKEKEEARKAREFREYEDRVTGRRYLPAPDPNKPDEEYTKTHSQLEAERLAQETANNQRLRERKRRIAARANSVFREYNAGRGARPRRQFNLPGPTIEVDPAEVREEAQAVFEESLSRGTNVRRPTGYQRQNRPQSRFQLFRQRVSAGYRRLTNEGVDVGQMPLVADSTREQPATIAEERELRRQQLSETKGRFREEAAESKIAAIRGVEREDNLDSALRPIQNENARQQKVRREEERFKELEKKEGDAWLESERIKKAEKDKIQQERLNRRKAKSIASKARQPETRAKVAAREEKQYMSEPAVARRTRVAEERGLQREDEYESELRLVQKMYERRQNAERREREYEAQIKPVRILNFSERTRSKQGASYQVPTYERQQSIDNPEYQAAVEQAREKVNRIAGLSEIQRASQLQRLIGKITIPKKISPSETPAGPVSRFTKFKESTSSLFRRFTGELADIKNEVTNEGVNISALPMFPDVGTGKNVLVRDTPRIARKRNEAAERLADRAETDAKIAAREAGPRAARREKLEAERAEKKRVIDEDRLNRRKAKSIESKRRQPETEAKVAARERKAYFSDPAVARRAAAGEVYDGASRPTMMVNPAIANRRAEIDRKIDERFSVVKLITAEMLSRRPELLQKFREKFQDDYDALNAMGSLDSEDEKARNALKKVFDPKATFETSAEGLTEVLALAAENQKRPLRERAQRMLSREKNPEYAKAVSNVKKWMDQEKIKDPAQREKFLSMINVPRYRDMDSLVEKPNAYKVQVQKTRDKDYINLAELRDHAAGRSLPPTDNPELQRSLGARVVEDAIQRKYYSDMGPLTAEETASRDARAQKIRDRLIKNIRPYNDDWRREQRRAKIEQIMTRPEEILSEAEKNAKADLIARAAKGEDVYELDPAKSGKGRKGSGGGDGGGGGGGDDPPDDGDDGKGGKGKGRGRGGKGDSTSVTAESIVINAKTVIANGAPVNVIAKTVMTGIPPKGGAAASSGAGAASGTPPVTGAPVVASGAVTAPGAVPSGPIMPGTSTARFVRMSAFGPVYSTAPAAGAAATPGATVTGTAATTAAGASIAVGGAGMSGLFGSLFGGGGGGGFGGGTAGPFGLGGEFGEAGNRTFGADRLMSVNRLKAMRNAYEQNMGSLSGSNVGVSRSQLVNTAQTTMMDIVDHEGSFKSLVQSASDAGLATEAADIQQAYDSMLDPSKTIADLATDLLKLQTALANLGKAAKAAEEDVASSDDVKEAAKKTQGQVGITSLLANYAAEEQDKVRQDLEREGNRRLGNLREGLQANTTQQSFFGWTVGQSMNRRRLLKEYATTATGGNPNELYRGGDISVYRPATVVKGIEVRGERRVNIREATQADLEYTQQKLAQKNNAALSVQDLTTLQKTMNEEKSQRNQTSMASKFSHITQKAQQANYWATAAFNAPTDVMNLVDQAVRPALNAEKTMITARTLALTPEAYGNAMQAAQTQQSMFGGTLTKNIGAVTGFIPMANAYGVDINKTFNVARKLAAFDPAQGTEGAQIALREFLSGNMSSLSRRFELSRSALTQINQGDASEMIDSLDNLLAGMGITDRLIDDQAASMATKYDKMLGRLESVQLHFSKLAVNAISPILEKFAGEDSWMATKTKTDTTTSVLSERVAKVGDDVITNSKNGSKTIKDLDLNSATFFEDLDSVISNANDAMIKENKLIEDTTGVDVNAKLYKRVNALKPWEREKYLADIRFKTMSGMGVESAIRQTMNEQTDYAGFEQFVTSRRSLGELGLTQADTDKRVADANTAILGQSGTKLTVKEMTVLDGDTFRFELPGDVAVDGRILGLDAPESDTEEGKIATNYLESLVKDPNNQIDIIKGYGQDENGREIIRAEITNLLTGEKYDLGTKMVSEGMADFEDFGASGNVTKEIQNIYAAYAPIAESVADQGKGVVNSVAARGGYGSAIRPSQEAINAQYANTYGIGGNQWAGLAPAASAAAVAGGVIGQMLIPIPVGGAVIGATVAAGLAAGVQQWYQSDTYDKDTSIEKVQGEIAEQRRIDRRAKVEEAIAPKARLATMNAAKNEFNIGLQDLFDRGLITEEDLKERSLTDANVAEINKILTDKDPEATEPAGGWTPGLRKLLSAATSNAGALTEELANEYEKRRADIESSVMQQVSSLNPAYQGVLDLQVPSSLDPSKTVPWIQEAMDTMALQATSGTEVEGAESLSSAKIDKEATSYTELLNLFLNPANQEAIAKVVNAGELVKIPTGETTTRIDPETKKEVEEPVYTYTQLTPDRVHRAIVEKDSSLFNATLETANDIKVEGKSTFYEEAKKATEALLDEQTKLRETLVIRVSENAALLSFTGLGEVAARQAEESGVNAEEAIPGGYDTGTSGAAIPRTTDYNPLERAAAFIDGTELDASASGNKNAQIEMETLLKGSIKKIAKSVEAFDQIAATTYAFDVQFRGTFRNFVDSVKAAGKGANTIMSHMGQGNPKFALDYLDQMTGINAKQFTMQYQLNPGMPNKQINGPSATYGYTQGPMGTMKFVSDFFSNGDFAAQFNLGETMQMINMAASANTQIVQRNMQHNWQMQDLSRDNARSIAEINRNGMLSLANIHRGYVQQMLVLASQAEVNKRMSEVSTQEAISTADLPTNVRNEIDAKDKIGRANAQYLGQFNIEGYLKTSVGAQDTEMKGLFDQFTAMGNPDSPEAQKFWEEVIRPAANVRKDAALARSKDESLSTDEREAATQEYISLNENPELATRALAIQDEETKNRLRRASTIRQAEKNLERLQLQRQGMIATGARLAEQGGKGTPEEQAAVALQIRENQLALKENGEAMELASRTIGTLREQDAEWNLAFLEQWKQLKTGIGTTTAGVVLSIEELARNMDLQLTEAYRKFELARTDMITAFTRSATEIAIQVPLSLMPMYDAILAYQNMSARAQIAYNNGIEVTESVGDINGNNVIDPFEVGQTRTTGGPQAAFNIQMQGAQAAADILYPNKDDPARAKLLSTIAEYARTMFPKADPSRDKSKDGLPAGFDQFTMMYDGIQTLRVMVVNGKDLGLVNIVPTNSITPGDLNGNGILDIFEK